MENKTGTRREKERERVVDGERKGCAKNKKRERKRKRSSESEWKTQKRIQLVFNTHFSSTYLYLRRRISLAERRPNVRSSALLVKLEIIARLSHGDFIRLFEIFRHDDVSVLPHRLQTGFLANASNIRR